MTARKPFGRLHAAPDRCAPGRRLVSQKVTAEDELRGIARQLAGKPESRRLQNELGNRRAVRDSARDMLAAHLAECQTCTDAEAATS